MTFRPIAAVVSVFLLLAGPAAAQRVRLAVPLEELQARAAVDSNDPSAHYELALGYLVKHKYPEAERELHTAVEIEPRMAAAYLGLALLPFATDPKLWNKDRHDRRLDPETRGILTESDRLARLAFMLDPMVDLKVLGAVLPPRSTKLDVQGSSYNTLIWGLESFWISNYGEAFRFFDRLMQSVKEEDRAKKMPSFVYWYHGLAAAHNENYPVAVADFNVLLDRALEAEDSTRLVTEPFSAATEFRYFLGVFKSRGGFRSDALATLRQVAQEDLGLFAAHSELASLYEARRLWPEAIAERKRALEVFPENAGLQFDLASTLALSGDPGAIRALKEAAETNPRNPRIPYLLAQVAIHAGDRETAREALERFVALAPSKFRLQIQDARDRLAAMSRP
ncbi:MAG: tetratricopeptide repeat protein [Gemmatimonadales bacterium]